MIFKIIFTDNKDNIKEYHFISPSIDDAEGNLDSIFYPSLTNKFTEGGHRVVLYEIKECEGHKIDKLTTHIMDEGNSIFLKKWYLSSIGEIEENFLKFQEEQSLTNLLLN